MYVKVLALKKNSSGSSNQNSTHRSSQGTLVETVQPQELCVKKRVLCFKHSLVLISVVYYHCQHVYYVYHDV